MIARSIPGARKSLAFVVAALALSVTRATPARAQQPAAEPPAAGAPAAGAPAEGAPIPPSSPAATPTAEPTPAGAPVVPKPNAAPPTPQATEAAESSWFFRPPLTFSVGQGENQWSFTAYGFIEADYITDTTRSYNDSIGSALVARSDTYEGTVGRTQFSVRNTRLGFLFASPVMYGIKPSAVLEGDFFGNLPAPPTGSEATFYDSPTFRIRHAYLKLQGDSFGVIAGQTYDVFGWQNYYFPCTAEFLGLPNQLFARNGQLRVSGTIGADSAASIDLAVAAVRPAQRDGEVPDAEGGVRVRFNGWKGITTPGNVGTVALPLSIGVSGVVRQFRVNAFTPPPTQASNSVTGWGVSIDALIPVIPASNGNDRGNRLTLTGSFVAGTGIADLITAGGGARFPTLPNPAQANPPPLYAADIDNGLVSFDTQGVLHTITWQAFRAGLQYYFPGTGRLIFSANYTQAHSSNMLQLFPMGGAEIELLGSVADTSRYGDGNLFYDLTPAVRLGLSGQYTQVHYLDGNQPHNIRGMGQAVYQF